MKTINALRTDNCIFAFIDHQPFVAFPVQSIDQGSLVNNVTGLAKIARALGIPVILSTIRARGGPMSDPLFSQLSALFSAQESIDRDNTNAWADGRFAGAVAQSGRTHLVLCGLWTEVCVAQTAISALAAGYTVYFVADCSGGVSREAHEEGKRRMVQAGAVPMTWLAVMAELCPDNSAPEYQRLYQPVLEHGGAVGLGVQFVLAQMAIRGAP